MSPRISRLKLKWVDQPGGGSLDLGFINLYVYLDTVTAEKANKPQYRFSVGTYRSPKPYSTPEGAMLSALVYLRTLMKKGLETIKPLIGEARGKVEKRAEEWDTWEPSMLEQAAREYLRLHNKKNKTD